MSSDLRSDRHSNDDIRAQARIVRKAFGVEGCERVDILDCLNSGWVGTIGGRKKRLFFEIVADEEMGDADATAESAEDWARIRCKASVAADAARRIGRAVMTLAHELGHVVFNHSRAVMSRITGISATDRPKFLRAYESAESIADKFAAYFLIEEKLATKYQSPEEIAFAFGVSFKAAQICFDRIRQADAKPKVISGFSALLAELRSGRGSTSRQGEVYGHVSDKASGRAGINSITLCARCHKGPIHPVGGNRFECEDCGFISDQLQDGDTFDA